MSDETRSCSACDNAGEVELESHGGQYATGRFVRCEECERCETCGDRLFYSTSVVVDEAAEQSYCGSVCWADAQTPETDNAGRLRLTGIN